MSDKLTFLESALHVRECSGRNSRYRRGVYRVVNPLVTALAAELIPSLVTLSQTAPLPCQYSGQLLRTNTGALVTYSSNEMKKRARRKTELSGLIRNADIKGTASIDLLIGKSGEVTCLKVAPTHPLIKVSVERALTSWRFKPERENG